MARTWPGPALGQSMSGALASTMTQWQLQLGNDDSQLRGLAMLASWSALCSW